MTAEELRRKLNDEFAFGDWPDHYEVDAETYSNVCQAIFDNKCEETDHYAKLRVSLGINNGIFFKNVKLIIKPAEDKTYLVRKDIEVLYNLLQNQYISYENPEALKLIRKIRFMIGDWHD